MKRHLAWNVDKTTPLNTKLTVGATITESLEFNNRHSRWEIGFNRRIDVGATLALSKSSKTLYVLTRQLGTEMDSFVYEIKKLGSDIFQNDELVLVKDVKVFERGKVNNCCK